MKELEAEDKIKDLVRNYCSAAGLSYDVFYEFLFTNGNLYKMDNILEQVEIPVD